MRGQLLFAGVLCLGVVCLEPTVFAQSAPPANNYTDPKTWLCRPNRQDACAIDLTATVVDKDGKLSREIWSRSPDAPIDCFYVYPTISTDPTPSSDMTPDAAELNVIRQQFGRFASKCRPFAPLYRQVTLAGLRAKMASGSRLKLSAGLAYDDVRDAWKSYLEHDNQGRGFVLIGHSQGSFILAELIRQEIDGKAVQARMVAAIIPGATIVVPKGQDTGGSFQHVPVCRAASQAGCVIAYATFRATLPPPANSLFGRAQGGDVTGENLEAVCANPAMLSGDNGELYAYLDTMGRTITQTQTPRPWLNNGVSIETPWVSVPGLLTAKCTSNDFATYLEVTVHGDASSPRTADIVGDIAANGQVRPEWGLHLVDVNLAMGNLLDVVAKQTSTWQTQNRKGK